MAKVEKTGLKTKNLIRETKLGVTVSAAQCGNKTSLSGKGKTDRVIELRLEGKHSDPGLDLENPILKVCVKPEEDLRTVLKAIQRTVHCIALVVDEDRRLQGTITDGDFRRAVLKNFSLESKACEIMNRGFIAVDTSFTSAQIERIMNANGVDQIPILDEQRHLKDIVSRHSMCRQPIQRDNPILILAGGQGKRLRPLTDLVPKPMLPVKGQPIIEKLIAQISGQGFKDITVSLNYLGPMIESYLGDGSRWGCNIKYIREEEQLGTGGPLRLLPQSNGAPVLAVNGDLVTSVSFATFADFHESNQFDISIGVTTSSFQIPFGTVSTNSSGEVTALMEKPVKSYTINAGLYLVNPEFVALVPENQYFAMTDLISMAIDRKARVGAFPIHESWLDVGLPENYAMAQDGLPGNKFY